MSSNDCDCGNKQTNDTNLVAQQQVILQQADNTCTRTFNETVTEAAELIITPNIVSGPTSTRCMGEPRIVRNFPEVVQTCGFTVEQDICAQFEVIFGAHAEVGRTGLICGTPEVGECQAPPPVKCCLGVGETNQGNTEVTTVATLHGNPLENFRTSFSIKICSPNCKLEGSHFNFEVRATRGPSVHFNLNHTEFTEMFCDGDHLLLTAVDSLHVGNTRMEDITFNIEITPTSFSVNAMDGTNTIFTSVSTTTGEDVIPTSPCVE